MAAYIAFATAGISGALEPLCTGSTWEPNGLCLFILLTISIKKTNNRPSMNGRASASLQRSSSLELMPLQNVLQSMSFRL
jgi:hypothetical protein